MVKIETAKLKRLGYINQSDKEYFTVRVKLQAGNVTSEQMENISRIAVKYGRSYVGLTTRLGFEIPWIKYEDLENVKMELEKVGLAPGATGPTVRPIVSCKGTICVHGLGDTQGLCKLLDERYFGREVGAKFKIGIVGCPNNCAKTQLNDLGFMGQCYPKTNSELCIDCEKCVSQCKVKAIQIIDDKAEIDYSKCIKCGDCTKTCPTGAMTVDKQGFVPFLGGKFGRKYKLGDRMDVVLSEEEAVEFAGKVIEFFVKNANKGERFGDTLNRIGMENVSKELGI